MLGSFRSALTVTVLVPSLSGCFLAGEKREPAAASQKKATENVLMAAVSPVKKPPKLCAAVRGNGNYVITHFTSLARLSEHYGAIDGIAGGSSGSITVFLYESMRMNPAVRTCAGKDCTPEETGARLGLLLKTVQQYVTAITTDTDEALAVRGLAPIAERVQKEGVKALLDLNPVEAGAKLYTILSSKDLKDLINPEILSMLADVTHVGTAAPEVYDAITGFGSFKSTDPKIFFRPGVLSFEGLAAKIGRMGSFYAGYAPADLAAFEQFFAACGATQGKIWSEIATQPATPDGLNCARLFDKMVLDFRGKLVQAEETTKSRIDDPVGSYMHAIVSTSVLMGQGGFDAFNAALARYREGLDPAFVPSFADVHYGYFGDDADLGKIVADPLAFGDLKTKKAYALGSLPYRVALATSPAEPGLARIKELDAKRVSAGGWPDLHPVQLLKNIGCEKVVYVTRRGEDSKFARGVALLLGMPPEDDKAMYDLDNPQSSYSRALALADAVWCTDWDSFKDAEITEMATESYRAVLESKDPFFTQGPRAYTNLSAATNLRGCTPGAPPLPPPVAP